MLVPQSYASTQKNTSRRNGKPFCTFVLHFELISSPLFQMFFLCVVATLQCLLRCCQAEAPYSPRHAWQACMVVSLQ